MPHYGFVGASKAALESLVRTFAQELGRAASGSTRSRPASWTPTRCPISPTASSCWPSSRSARRPGPTLTPEDVAGAVYLLCLPEAAMINGATLFVDGGFAISG